MNGEVVHSWGVDPGNRKGFIHRARLLPNDRLMVLFERPAVISQHQGLTVTSELSAESLREFIEATRGRAGPSPMEESPLPRRQRLDD